MGRPSRPVRPPNRWSRATSRLWQEDGSIQEVFPSLAGEGSEEYLGWIRTTGWEDHDSRTWVVPSEENVLELMKGRWLAGRRGRGHRA